jgi:hypothetical protein
MQATRIIWKKGLLSIEAIQLRLAQIGREFGFHTLENTDYWRKKPLTTEIFATSNMTRQWRLMDSNPDHEIMIVWPRGAIDQDGNLLELQFVSQYPVFRRLVDTDSDAVFDEELCQRLRYYNFIKATFAELGADLAIGQAKTGINTPEEEADPEILFSGASAFVFQKSGWQKYLFNLEQEKLFRTTEEAGMYPYRIFRNLDTGEEIQQWDAFVPVQLLNSARNTGDLPKGDA